MTTGTPPDKQERRDSEGALSPLPAKDLAESINELDRLIGTRDFTSRLPLSFSIAPVGIACSWFRLPTVGAITPSLT